MSGKKREMKAKRPTWTKRPFETIEIIPYRIIRMRIIIIICICRYYILLLLLLCWCVYVWYEILEHEHKHFARKRYSCNEYYTAIYIYMHTPSSFSFTSSLLLLFRTIRCSHTCHIYNLLSACRRLVTKYWLVEILKLCVCVCVCVCLWGATGNKLLREYAIDFTFACQPNDDDVNWLVDGGSLYEYAYYYCYYCNR